MNSPDRIAAPSAAELGPTLAHPSVQTARDLLSIDAALHAEVVS